MASPWGSVQAALALLAGCALPGAGLAACVKPASTVFSCVTKAGKVIQVCDAGRTIDYSFGRPGAEPEIVVRAPRASASTFQWPGVGRSISYAVEVPNGEFTYSVFFAMDRLDAGHPVEAGVIVRRKGQDLATVSCLPNDKLVQNIEGIDLKKME